MPGKTFPASMIYSTSDANGRNWRNTVGEYITVFKDYDPKKKLAGKLLLQKTLTIYLHLVLL